MHAPDRPELAALFEETVSLYHRLSATAARFYGRGALSGPRRTVLVALARSGPQTVAHLARLRSQSRQRLQPLVSALIREGLLSAGTNPLHRQSPLISLTERGAAAVAAIERREREERARLMIGSSAQRLRLATAVLREVRLAIEQAADPIVQPTRPRPKRTAGRRPP